MKIALITIMTALSLGVYSKELSELEKIGKKIFFDDQLSEPVGQSCSTCHQPDKAFSNSFIVHPGTDQENFSNRNTPSLSYVTKNPPFKYDYIEGNIVPVGGFFWDGRANNLKEQILQPFVNPLEMGVSSLDQLVKIIKTRPYYKSLKKVNKLKQAKNEQILQAIQNAIEAYLKSSEFNKFNSKYDLWLKKEVTLTTLEALGLTVFARLDKGNCAACHTLKKVHAEDLPLFTDFTYDNIGVPANKSNPFYTISQNINPLQSDYIDYGLGQTERLKDSRFLGMFKVPSLRNVALTAPYMHNGVFNTLEEVVEFYNTRDLESRWRPPEVPYNVNQTELGNLSLTEIEIDALVAFMKTLTDDYVESNEK